MSTTDRTTDRTTERGARVVSVVSLTIDGRRVEAEENSYVLGAVRKLGIDIPTLCDHPDLEPIGACRLCMVEVTHPTWNGWSGLMTACLYPVKAGLEISTRSPAVLEARKGVLSLLAARCPGSEVVQKLAQRHGAPPIGLQSDAEADTCILCGLCTRVCDSYATGAITTCSRGALKRVGTFADQPPADCVGCGACVTVCPTGHIHAERSAEQYRIWRNVFRTATCSVDENHCIGCGSCVEACPFAVARVRLRAGAGQVATIPSEHCRGCGACVGACPTGAISQQGYEWQRILDAMGQSDGAPPADGAPPRDIVVMACARADVGASRATATAAGEPRVFAAQRSRAGDASRIAELPCTGRLSVPLVLATLAQGAQGALVMGRHEPTCRFQGAEEPARNRIATAKALCELIGISPVRIDQVEPAAGAQGPAEAVTAFRARVQALGPLSLDQALPRELVAVEGLDQTLHLAQWLARHAHDAGRGHSSIARWLAEHGLARANAAEPSVWAGSLPLLDVVGGALWGNGRLARALAATVDALGRLGVAGVGVQWEGDEPAPEQPCTAGGRAPGQGGDAMRFVLEPDEVAMNRPGLEGPARLVDDWLRERGADLLQPGERAKVATDGSSKQDSLVKALGHEPIDVGPDPLPDRFGLSAELRAQAETRLRKAEALGAAALLVSGPRALARWALLTRRGAWGTSRVLPVLGVELARLALAALPLGRRGLEALPTRRSPASEVSP